MKSLSKSTAVVVCNGRISDYGVYDKYFENAKLVICADGGAFHLRQFGIVPDILLGDFDSIDISDYEFFSSKTSVLKYPVKKDQTDSEIAVTLAAEKGCNPIYLIGASGSRMDHTLANLMLMFRFLDRGITCIVADENNEVYALRNTIVLDRVAAARVSIIPVTEKITGVTTKGLLYPLNNAEIELGSTLGISNEFTGDRAQISISGGLAIVVIARD
jgi:thiamine pyrophosphokinase